MRSPQAVPAQQGQNTLKAATPLSWADLRVEVCATFGDLRLPPSAWDTAVEELGGPVYMTWGWLQTWWQFYGGNDALRLFVFRAGEQIVGLLPFYLGRLGLGPLGVKVARLVGANIPPKVFDPPLADGWGRACLAEAGRWLAQNDGCDLVSVGPVSGPYVMRHGLNEDSHRGTSRKEDHPTVWLRPTGVCTIFELPDSFEAYLAGLGRNEQKNRRKYELKLLAKEYPVRVEVLREPGNRLETAFERFVEQHTQQWQAARMPGHFGAWPKALEYNRALVRTMAGAGRVRMLEIWAGPHYVAAQYAFALGQRWFWELPSRAVGLSWDRYSLGPSALVVLFKEAIREGARRVEGGLGHYEYKRRLGGAEHPVYHLWLAPRWSQSVQLRLAMTYAVQKGLGLALHKLWYRRLQPQLPKRWWRPQSQHWLRYDF